MNIYLMTKSVSVSGISANSLKNASYALAVYDGDTQVNATFLQTESMTENMVSITEYGNLTFNSENTVLSNEVTIKALVGSYPVEKTLSLYDITNTPEGNELGTGGGGGGDYSGGFGINISPSNVISANKNELATKEDLENYYDKDEIDYILEDEYYDKNEIGIKLDDYYNKSETDDLLDEKEDKLISDGNILNPTDSDFLSAVYRDSTEQRKMHYKSMTLSKLWAWIVSKTVTSISSESTNNDIAAAKAVWDLVDTKLDKVSTPGVSEVYCHNGSSQSMRQIVINIADSSAIPTSAAVLNFVNNILNGSVATGNGAFSYNTSQTAGLTISGDYDTNATRQIIKIGKMCALNLCLKGTAVENDANWTHIGTLASSFKPKRKCSIIAQVYSTNGNEAAGGYIDTSGQVVIWTNAKHATNNYQIRLNCVYECA